MGLKAFLRHYHCQLSGLMARKAGVEWSKLNVVNIPAPLPRNSFPSNSIEAGIAWSPYTAMPHSMVATEGGLVGELHLAMQVLHATKNIPEPVPLAAIRQAVDPQYLKKFAATRRSN